MRSSHARRTYSSTSQIDSRLIISRSWTPQVARPGSKDSRTASRMANLPGGSLVQNRRQARQRRDRTLLFLGAAVVLLCIPFISLISSRLHALQPADPPSMAGGSQSAQGAASQSLPSKPTTILLLGTDQRPGDSGFRTDVIILLTLNPAQGTAVAVSFPRDLWVKVPSLYEMKINSIFQLGGFDAMAEMFQANFGIKPDYYVLTNFNGFTQLIDSQGGIDVQAAPALTDRCDLPQAQSGSCTVAPGVVHMDGATALWYVRSRETSSDFDRLRRAQEVLFALLKKLANFNTLTKLTAIQNSLAGNVETDLSIARGLSFLPLATTLLKNPDQIKRAAISEDQATPMFSWNGEWILLPDDDAVKGVLRDTGVIQ